MKSARITAVSYALPSRIEDNAFLVKDMGLEWSAEDIYEKTGIRQRHIAASGECASDLGVAAAERLFEQEERWREKIDYVLFCSQSSDYVLPTTACLIHERLSLQPRCGALDINQGCTGFIYGLAVAKGLIEAGIAHNILLVTAETYSKYIDRLDRGTRTIFGDGAAAVLVSESMDERPCLSGFLFGTDGKGASNLIVPNSGQRKDINKSNHLFMDGPEVFQFSLERVPSMVRTILELTEETMDSIDWFVFHQANSFMLRHLRNKIHIPAEKFFLDMADTGNTVSASIPIALAKMKDKGVLKSGQKVLLAGFGVGYSWGGCLVEF